MVGRLSVCVEARMYSFAACCIERRPHPIADQFLYRQKRDMFLIWSIDPLLGKGVGPAISYRLVWQKYHLANHMPTVGATASQFTLPTSGWYKCRKRADQKKNHPPMVDQQSISCLLMSLVLGFDFVFEFEFSCICLQLGRKFKLVEFFYNNYDAVLARVFQYI